MLLGWLRLGEGHESKVEDDGTRIFGYWVDDGPVLNVPVGPDNVHLSGGQVGILPGLILVGDEGPHEAD